MNPSDHAGRLRDDPGRTAGQVPAGTVPASTGGRRTGAWVIAAILLVAAIAASLIVPIYARTTPMLGDFPFFYWYQLLLVPVVAIVSWLAYLRVRNTRPG